MIAQIAGGLVFENVQSVLYFSRISDYQSAEESVPNRKDIAIVAVGPRTLEVVMEFVHVGCDENQTNGFIYPCRYGDIGVCRVSKKYGDDSVHQVKGEGRTDNQSGKQREEFPKHVISRMVTRSAGHVNLRIAVVHHVKAPHETNLVQKEMNEVLSDQVKCH